LRSQLLLEGSVPFHAVEFVIGANAVIVLVSQIQGPGRVPDGAELGGAFAVLTVAAVRAVSAQTDSVALEEAGIFLLRDVLSQGVGSLRSSFLAKASSFSAKRSSRISANAFPK